MWIEIDRGVEDRLIQLLKFMRGALPRQLVSKILRVVDRAHGMASPILLEVVVTAQGLTISGTTGMYPAKRAKSSVLCVSRGGMLCTSIVVTILASWAWLPPVGNRWSKSRSRSV